MKMLTRTVLVRLHGNDIGHEYQIPEYDDLQEAIRMLGEDHILRMINYMLSLETRSQARATLLHSLQRGK